jgi:nucleoside-diphosphate-sugar epimerase
MRVLVTGSAGHLGEALVRTLRERGREVAGLDLLASPFTTHVGSIADPESLRRRCVRGVDVVMHAAIPAQAARRDALARRSVETNVSER